MRTAKFHRMFPLLVEATHARGPMIAADHLANLLDRPLDQVCKDGRLLAEGLLTAHQLYKSDLLIVFSDVMVEAEACGVKLEYSTQRNPHPVSQLEPNAVRQIDLTSAGRIPAMLQAARICRKSLDEKFPIFFSMKDPFSLAALVIGVERFFTALLEAPKLVHQLMNICCKSQLSLIDAVCSEGYIPFIGAPISSGGLIGTDWFGRFAQPYIKLILDRIHEHNTLCCMHICGEVSPLANLLPSLNLDMLSFEEWHAPMWEQMPNTIPMGYVPTDLFVHGTTDSVREATLKCLNSLPQPSILSTACDLPANASPDLVKCCMDVV